MVKSIEKMFKVLSLYSMDKISLSIKEIQEELGFPKSTIFRILDTMERSGYIERNLDNHRYSLGFSFFRLGSIVQSQLDFRTVALQTMKKLVETTSETVELNIIDGLNRVCVEKVDSPLDVRNFVRIGERKPLHIGASGKVLISFLKEDAKNNLLKKLVEANMIPSIDEFTKKIEDIRQKGYCLTKGERVPGSFAVSAPLFANNGVMVANLTIAGPIQRLSEEREHELANALLEAVKEINDKLGYISNF